VERGTCLSREHAVAPSGHQYLSQHVMDLDEQQITLHTLNPNHSFMIQVNLVILETKGSSYTYDRRDCVVTVFTHSNRQPTRRFLDPRDWNLLRVLERD